MSDGDDGGVDPAIAGPIGLIVSLIAAIEPGLRVEQIREAVIGVAGGRAKSRQLAAALRARPAVLLDGLSPAPRAVADLLIALRRAGAVSVSWPRCTKCGKELRTYQRRGLDWYCAVCGPRLEPCFACGNVRRVATRDRSGQPRFARCPDGDSRDPIALICALVTTLQSEAEPEVITEAVREVAPRPSHQQRLARALEDNPALLSGAGHLAPVPAVLRLIEVLNDHGVTGVLRPSCPRCHRGVRISKPLDGERVCRSCLAKARVERCVRCGTIREPATRDEQRRPVCPSCLVADPANLETCVNCGRRRPVKHPQRARAALCDLPTVARPGLLDLRRAAHRAGSRASPERPGAPPARGARPAVAAAVRSSRFARAPSTSPAASAAPSRHSDPAALRAKSAPAPEGARAAASTAACGSSLPAPTAPSTPL